MEQNEERRLESCTVLERTNEMKQKLKVWPTGTGEYVPVLNRSICGGYVCAGLRRARGSYASYGMLLIAIFILFFMVSCRGQCESDLKTRVPTRPKTISVEPGEAVHLVEYSSDRKGSSQEVGHVDVHEEADVTERTVAIVRPKSDEGRQNWTQLRGKHGRGVSKAKGLPTTWNDKQNVRWKTALPGPGTSSPIVWRENIYVTCFTGYEWPKEHEKKHRVGELERHLICVDCRTGRIKWKRSHAAEYYDRNLNLIKANIRVHGFATSTPTCDANGVYVFHGADGVIAYSHEGEKLWSRSVGTGTHHTGSAASLMMHEGLLLICAEVESGTMFGLAARSGDVVWKQPWKTWGYASPIVTPEGGRPQLLLSHDTLLKSLDPKTGKELWRREGETGWVHNTMLTAGDDIIFSCSNHRVIAIPADGGEILWHKRVGSAYSPIMYDGERVYWIRDSILHCHDAKTGQKIFVDRLPTGSQHYAAPIKADEKIYLVSREGGAAVVAAGPEYRLLAHNRFAEDDSMFDSTPAIVDDCLVLRSYRNLYCIGSMDK